MIKHVGKHNQQKVVVLYRQVPNEPHMCLIAYSDTLPRQFHDAIMLYLESDAGQQAKTFADVLFRNLLADGRVILHAMHKEGMIKKVQTNQVIMTPTNKTTIRLDELNDKLNTIEAGGAALEEMARLDSAKGLGKGKAQLLAEAAALSKTTSASVNPDSPAAPVSQSSVAASYMVSALSDKQIALDLIQQSKNLQQQGAALLAESARLAAEAERMDPVPVVKQKTAKKAVKAPKVVKAKATQKEKKVKSESKAN